MEPFLDDVMPSREREKTRCCVSTKVAVRGYSSGKFNAKIRVLPSAQHDNRQRKYELISKSGQRAEICNNLSKFILTQGRRECKMRENKLALGID